MEKATIPMKNLWLDIPYTFTRMNLCVLGAIPCSLQRPYLPTKTFKSSTLLYCTAVYGGTLYLAYVVVASMLQVMADAYPYNHFDYIIAFEIIVWMLPNILPLVSWLDTAVLNSTLEAWHDFMTKYQAVMHTQMPRYYLRERVVQFLIIMTPISSWTAGYFVTDISLVDWKLFLASFFPATIMLSLVHQWVGWNMTIALVSTELAAYMKERIKKETLTSKLVEDCKGLWLLLRHIMDTMSNMRVPLFCSILSYVTATIMSYESILFYLQTGNSTVTTLNFIGLWCFIVPLICLCRTGQNATERVQYLYEEVFSPCNLESFSELSQREIGVTYFMKRSKKPALRLFGFTEVHQSVLPSLFSEMFMYVLILAQFHHMVSPDE